ncbi:hypothetical protein [Flavobacterium sp.]|uniref:hypothetical protein n=1 Tax=Flavobacterium sp. TaxID=239 RepID=UPI0026266F98|nr:hypothetical protein [Flavobacterium sp.]MDD3003553.1 hypothetical protein [Flavobacterium sp.]
MKKILFILLLLCYQINFGQELSLKIFSNVNSENTIIDSIGYQKKHLNAKSILNEVRQFSEQLIKTGYLESELIHTEKPNDTLFEFKFQIGNRTKWIHIYNSDRNNNALLEKDTLVIPINSVEFFLKNKLDLLESKGFSLATVQLTNFEKVNNNLYASLEVKLNTKRNLDEIIVSGYDKFPGGHLKNIKRLYKRKTFNKSNLNNLYNNFNNFNFINQTRYPEILFTNDSTKIYVYLEKTKANQFDGYIGFTNDENSKLVFTGYLDLKLVNILNSGEEFKIYWKSDNNKQVTFNTEIEIPYIFKSPLGVKASLNIFKQDSTFQTTKTAIDLGYYFNYTKKIFLGYQSTESSDIQNSSTNFISDYKSDFITASFDYKKINQDLFFKEQTSLLLKIGAGQRNSKIKTLQQTFVELNGGHDFYLSPKNIINIRSKNYYLSSNHFIINELYRFGGIQSIRGFNENSLQANYFASLLSEYRYILSSNLYIHSVLDYGFYEDQTSNTKNKLLGLGFGFGIYSKSGLLNFIYANGSTNKQSIDLDNSIAHIRFSTSF